MPKFITSHDVLEPLKQVLLASRDVIISGQICGSKLQRVFTLGDGCYLPTEVRSSFLFALCKLKFSTVGFQRALHATISVSIEARVDKLTPVPDRNQWKLPAKGGLIRYWPQTFFAKEKAHKHNIFFWWLLGWGGSPDWVVCAEPKERKLFRLGTRPGGSVTGVTEKLFMCQMFMCLSGSYIWTEKQKVRKKNG